MIKLDEYELQSLANFDNSDFWALIAKVVEHDLDMLENEVTKSPKLSDDDLTEDLRFKIGGIARLKWVLELPEEARKLLK
jgi:hypothetical protein